jgi:hypothetical protein
VTDEKEFAKKTATRFAIVAGALLIVLGTAVLSSQSVSRLFLSVISMLKGNPPASHWLDNLRLLGFDVLLIGIVTLALGWLVIPRWSSLANRGFVLALSSTPVRAILLIWFLITVSRLSLPYLGNEVDILPSARQSVQRSWLPNDWYLNLEIGYRQPFNFVSGSLVSLLGFRCGAYIGRLLIYFLLAVALYAFFKAFRLRLSYGLLAVLLFLSNQSLIAGEWIAGGVETKTIAYALVILSCATFFQKRYLLGFAFAGAAMSFHALVGLYAMFCIAVALLLTGTSRPQWRTYVTHSWPFFLTGIFGLQAIIIHLLPQHGIRVIEAWEIYVTYRVPHHVLPSAWPAYLWVAKLSLATCLFLVMYFIAGHSRAIRFISAYALGSVLLFFFGLSLYTWGETHQLRYYWFRFPDVMVPFMSIILIAFALDVFPDRRKLMLSIPDNLQNRMRALLTLGRPTLLTVAVILIMLQSTYQLQMRHRGSPEEKARVTATGPVLEWIEENTSKDAVFLVDPTMSDFYIRAQRSMFVSFKHSPQSAADILEWYKRIKIANGNRPPAKSGFGSLEEIKTDFYNLDEDEIRQIGDSYRVDYYLGLPQQPLTFDRVYSDTNFTLYKTNGVTPVTGK